MNFKALFATAALLASQSFAIAGLGFHYAPGFGSKLKAENKTPVTDNGIISFDHDGFDGTIQGFGFKLWIDILPIFDIEATYNIQFGSYDANLYVDGVEEPIPLKFELAGTPFGKATPKFVASNMDISLTYPITFIPFIRPYVGGGFTYHLNSFVMNSDFVGGLINDPKIAAMITDIAKMDGLDADAIQQKAADLEALGQALKTRVQDQASDESLNTSIGGHVMAGMRIQFLVAAVYCNFKYYFGGDYPKEFDAGNMTLEAGVGFGL